MNRQFNLLSADHRIVNLILDADFSDLLLPLLEVILFIVAKLLKHF